jgi:hypothetical protein
MLRLPAPTSSTHPADTAWPEYKPKRPTTVFSRRPPLRELRVVVDAAILDRAKAAESELGAPDVLLAGLLTHPYVSLMRYADAGPPSGLPRHDAGPMRGGVTGWVVVPELPEEPINDRVGVTASAGDFHRWTSIHASTLRIAESDEATSAYATLDPDQQRKRRRADALAARAAQAVGADVFITERAYLHAVKWRVADGVLIAAPGDALPVVSLYLRTQNEYCTWRSLEGRGSSNMNRALFYLAGAWDLLPAGRRWYAACAQHAQSISDDRLTYLAYSLFQRVQRALQARDEALGALNLPQDNDTADAALGDLDEVLLALMGAVDVTARVAHLAVGFDPDRTYGAAWHRAGWRDKLTKTEPKLGALVTAGSAHANALTILSSLRNSIHGAALDALATLDRGSRRDGTLVGLPHADGENLVAAMDALGGRQQWGVAQLLPGRYHADPGVLIDQIFRAILTVLNDLMAATPVENLPGVALEANDSLPPADGPFSAHTGASVRLQLGL